MFRMIFYNDKGSVTFGGGASESNWRIIEAEGLGLSGKSYKSCVYEDSIGQETVDVAVNARTITLKGDFFMGENYRQEYKAALSVFDSEGTLELAEQEGDLRIKAYCTQFLPLLRKGNYIPFTIQFVCDKPYFESAEAYEIPIYRVVPMLNSSFTFPGVFSTRLTGRNVFISSDAETEPTIIIQAGANPGGYLEIMNRTSGESLNINYEPLSEEFITVDVKNRKIYNQNGDSLLHYLADDSFFDGFHLYPGDNDIEVRIGDSNEELKVFLRYNENFLEAVI